MRVELGRNRIREISASHLRPHWPSSEKLPHAHGGFCSIEFRLGIQILCAEPDCKLRVNGRLPRDHFVRSLGQRFKSACCAFVIQP